MRRFVAKLVNHLKKHKDIPELPRSKLYSTRPLLVATDHSYHQNNLLVLTHHWWVR